MSRQRIAPSTVIVEFTGLAGVGKTAVAERVRSILHECYGMEVNLSRPGLRARIKVLLSPRFHVRFVRGIAALVRACNKNPVRLMRCARIWGLTLGVMETLRMVPGIHIVDHGFLQSLRGIAPNCEPDDPLWLGRRLLRLVPRPDMMVVLTGDTEAIRYRRQSRKKYRESSLDVCIISKAVARQEQFKIFVTEVLDKYAENSVVFMHNPLGQDLNQLAAAIVKRVVKCRDVNDMQSGRHAAS